MTKRKLKTPEEKSKFVTITVPPLKLEKHKAFSKQIGESLSEFYRISADERVERMQRKLKK